MIFYSLKLYLYGVTLHCSIYIVFFMCGRVLRAFQMDTRVKLQNYEGKICYSI